VRTEDGSELRCRPRGRFKKDGTSIMVGDWAELTVLSASAGVLEKILERRTCLARPAVANVDQVVVVCSPKSPPLSLQILDRLLVLAEAEGLTALICLNKADLSVSDEQIALLRNIYTASGYQVLATSALDGRGLERLKELLTGRISVLAGQSGVGKSSLLNRLQQGVCLRTDVVSERLRGGRHTTRHVELLSLDGSGMVADSPGFNRLEVKDVSVEMLRHCFPEFVKVDEACRFQGCRHRSEPECAVKEELQSGRVAGERYRNYLAFLAEIEEARGGTWSG